MLVAGFCAAWAATGTATVRGGVLEVELTEDVAALPPGAGMWPIHLPTRAILTGFTADGPATLAAVSPRTVELTIPEGASTRRISWSLEIAPYTAGVWRFAPDELPVDVLTVDGVEVPVRRGVLRVPVEPEATPSASLGVARAGGSVVARLVVEVPDPLSAPPPDGLGVVYLVDRSCSQGDLGVKRQLATVAETVRRLPGASHVLLGWDRGVTPAWVGWVPGEEVSVPDALPLAHGTDPAAALDAAGAALAAWPGPRRLVWFTDRLYPAAVDEAALAARLPPDTVVHLVVTDGHAKYGAYWAPTREAPLVDLARGGVAGNAVLREPWRVAEALVRPVTVEHAEVVVDGEAAPDWPLEPLDEGRVVATVVTAPRAPRAVTVRGYAWSEPWAVTATRTAASDADTLRWMWAEPPELPEADARKLGRRAAALNPWRSLQSDGRSTWWVPAATRQWGIGG
ncbi:MAG: hypothetical protein ABMA64_23000, partial [Myxococcota bacterium]